MLWRQERRALDEIEKRLAVDDPDFVRDFDVASGQVVPEADHYDAPPRVAQRRFPGSRPSARSLLTMIAGAIAVMCVFLGEGGGALLSGALTALLYVFRDWELWS